MGPAPFRDRACVLLLAACRCALALNRSGQVSLEGSAAVPGRHELRPPAILDSSAVATSELLAALGSHVAYMGAQPCNHAQPHRMSTDEAAQAGTAERALSQAPAGVGGSDAGAAGARQSKSQQRSGDPGAASAGTDNACEPAGTSRLVLWLLLGVVLLLGSILGARTLHALVQQSQSGQTLDFVSTGSLASLSRFSSFSTELFSSMHCPLSTSATSELGSPVAKPREGAPAPPPLAMESQRKLRAKRAPVSSSGKGKPLPDLPAGRLQPSPPTPPPTQAMHVHMVCGARVLDAALTSTLAFAALLLLFISAAHQHTSAHLSSHPRRGSPTLDHGMGTTGAGTGPPHNDLPPKCSLRERFCRQQQHWQGDGAGHSSKHTNTLADRAFTALSVGGAGAATSGSGSRDRTAGAGLVRGGIPWPMVARLLLDYGCALGALAAGIVPLWQGQVHTNSSQTLQALVTSVLLASKLCAASVVASSLPVPPWHSISCLCTLLAACVLPSSNTLYAMQAAAASLATGAAHWAPPPAPSMVDTGTLGACAQVLAMLPLAAGIRWFWCLCVYTRSTQNASHACSRHSTGSTGHGTAKLRGSKKQNKGGRRVRFLGLVSSSSSSDGSSNQKCRESRGKGCPTVASKQQQQQQQQQQHELAGPEGVHRSEHSTITPHYPPGTHSSLAGMILARHGEKLGPVSARGVEEGSASDWDWRVTGDVWAGRCCGGDCGQHSGPPSQHEAAACDIHCWRAGAARQLDSWSSGGDALEWLRGQQQQQQQQQEEEHEQQQLLLQRYLEQQQQQQLEQQQGACMPAQLFFASAHPAPVTDEACCASSPVLQQQSREAPPFCWQGSSVGAWEQHMQAQAHAEQCHPDAFGAPGSAHWPSSEPWGAANSMARVVCEGNGSASSTEGGTISTPVKHHDGGSAIGPFCVEAPSPASDAEAPMCMLHALSADVQARGEWLADGGQHQVQGVEEGHAQMRGNQMRTDAMLLSGSPLHTRDSKLQPWPSLQPRTLLQQEAAAGVLPCHHDSQLQIAKGRADFLDESEACLSFKLFPSELEDAAEERLWTVFDGADGAATRT